MEFTQTRLAQICGVSATRIRQLTREGILETNQRERYPVEMISKYIATIRVSEPQGENFRQLLEQERFREKKRENDEAERVIAPVEVLEEALEKTCSVMIPHLEMLPLNLKRRCPELTGDQIQIVKEVVAECRNTMAEAEIVLDES